MDSFYTRLNNHYQRETYKKKINMKKKRIQGSRLKTAHKWKVPISQRTSFCKQRIPEQYEEKTVEIIIFITYRHGDKNIVQHIRITSMPIISIARWEACELLSLNFLYFQNNSCSTNWESKYMLKGRNGANVVKFRAISEDTLIMLFIFFWCFYC